MADREELTVEDAWDRYLKATLAMLHERPRAAFRDDGVADVTRVARRLLHPPGVVVLTSLMHLPPGVTLGLLPEIVVAATVDRTAGLARETLGRLARPGLEHALVPLVRERAEQANGDEIEYRRLGELLDHLGLDAALAGLLAQASRWPHLAEFCEEFSA